MAHLFVIPGHGAGDPGAGGGGYNEAERVRALATKMKELGGSNVTLADFSRNYYADNGISSLNISKDWEIIELHMDSAGSTARGGHVIVSNRFDPDKYDNALAKFISGMFPGRSNSLVKRGDLANVNRAANKGYSYRLIECCFISNESDRTKFNNNLDAVAAGILKAFDISSNASGWQKDATGWWYRNADGSYKKNEWYKENGYWYWFDDKGYAATEWKQIDGKWYYFNREGEGPECAMIHSTVRNIWGMWYAFNSYGEMIEGSIKINSNGSLNLD